jgi:molybdopterin adenylyltransferase
MARQTASVLTVSDGVTHGTRVDTSGDVAAKLLIDAGFQVTTRELVADEQTQIEAALTRLAATNALIVTTGGTGFGPRDVTPEATKAVLDREAPGLAELMRASGVAHTPMASLSRATAGTIGAALVINLPGSPSGVKESLQAILPIVPHAVGLLSGDSGTHPTGHGSPPAPPAPAQAWVGVKAIKVVAGSPPCRVGASMSIVPQGAVTGSLGCAEFDAEAVAAAAEVASAGEPDTRVFHHDLGDIEVFLEPHRPPARALIVSATDVARALRSHLQRLGYDVVVLESREERVTPADGPVVARIEELDLPAFEVAVLTDHDAPDVPDALAALLASPVGFVGVMGSRRHVGHYLETLRAQGFADVQLARIRSPLGLDIGGREPEQIALSIAAGIVADANDKQGGWLDR